MSPPSPHDRSDTRKGLRGPRRAPDGTHTIEMPTAPLLRSEDWPGRTRSRALVLASLLAVALYLGWWISPGHVGNPWLFALLAACELFAVLNLAGLWQAVWSADFTPPPPGSTHFSVDVFIPTYGEPLEVLRPTVEAAVAMDGPHQTYVLDDAVRDEVRELAEAAGARYVPRESSVGAKAGNLNNALRRSDGELVVVFDADHVPRHDFLTHLVGFFEDEEVAIVQTPQFYRNAPRDPVAAGAWRQQTIFYGPLLRGRDPLGSTFLVGTNAIIRREALREISGFEEASVVEDLVTSMQMIRRGWKVQYFPYVLAEGMGPDSMTAYISQQFRWARGTFDALLGRREPFRDGLSPMQRFQYLLSHIFYLVGFVTLGYLALPLFALLGQTGPFGLDSATFLLFYVPYIVTSFVMLRTVMRGHFGIRNVQFTFGSFPVYIAAFVATLLGRDASFEATGADDGPQSPPALAWVTVGAFVVTLGALIASPVLGLAGGWSWIAVFWTVINLWMLWPMTRLTVEEAFRAWRGRHIEPPHPREPMLERFDRPPLPELVFAQLESD